MIIPRSDPSTSGQANVPSSAEERAKRVVVDDYKFGSDLDPEEVRIFDKGLTRVEVRTDCSSRSIIIPLDYDLLEDMVSMVPSFTPLCSAAENRTLQALKDSGLSLGISGMALRVSFLPHYFCILFPFPLYIFTDFWLFIFLFALPFLFLDFHFGDRERPPIGRKSGRLFFRKWFQYTSGIATSTARCVHGLE